MACNDNNSSSCGCTHQHSAECIFYKGDSVTCIPLTKGMDLEEALYNLATYVCEEIDPPSGHIYVVESCDEDNIAVTTTVEDDTTTYEICLNTDIIDNITTNTTNISTLFNCVESGVLDLTTNTPEYVTLSEVSSEDCGRILSIDFNPSGTPVYDGIIYNDTDAVGTTGGVGDKTLKSFNYTYDSNSLLAVKDEIRFVSNGQILGDGDLVDTVKIELWEGGITQLYGESFGGFDKVNKQSWNLDGILTKTSDGEGLLNLKFSASGKQNGTKSNFTSNTAIVVNADVTGIDYDNLTIKIIYVHDSTSGSTYNFARQLMVEVRKYLN